MAWYQNICTCHVSSVLVSIAGLGFFSNLCSMLGFVILSSEPRFCRRLWISSTAWMSTATALWTPDFSFIILCISQKHRLFQAIPKPNKMSSTKETSKEPLTFITFKMEKSTKKYCQCRLNGLCPHDIFLMVSSNTNTESTSRRMTAILPKLSWTKLSDIQHWPLIV